MSQGRIIIAVDGPAGAGKGAVCRAVAHRYGLAYLDTGALYRAVAMISLQEESLDADFLAQRAATMPFAFNLHVEESGGIGFKALLDGEDVSVSMREERVGNRASEVAAMGPVRKALLGFQRRYGIPKSAILDGRDVGTVVAPEAPLKIFLSADLEVRAQRRAFELQQKGKTANFPDILKSMAERDARDMGRKDAPLMAAVDAVEVDTTPLTLKQSIEKVSELVENVLRSD